MESYEVYFQFKPFYQKKSAERALLSDFIEVSAAEEIKKQIDRIIVFPHGINAPVRLTAIQIVQLIHQAVNRVSVIPIGESSALYEPVQEEKDNPLLVFLRVAFSAVLLFFGSALAIMYFHADVNMKEVHQTVYQFISGKKAAQPVLFSISYSIGIGAGIAIFFEVINKLKNKENPGPLELEIHQADKEIRDYLRDQEGKKEN